MCEIKTAGETALPAIMEVLFTWPPCSILRLSAAAFLLLLHNLTTSEVYWICCLWLALWQLVHLCNDLLHILEAWGSWQNSSWLTFPGCPSMTVQSVNKSLRSHHFIWVFHWRRAWSSSLSSLKTLPLGLCLLLPWAPASGVFAAH